MTDASSTFATVALAVADARNRAHAQVTLCAVALSYLPDHFSFADAMADIEHRCDFIRARGEVKAASDALDLLVVLDANRRALRLGIDALFVRSAP